MVSGFLRRLISSLVSFSGSIKANIGHLEGGSGLASILKSIMILENGVIPPNALFEKLNPNIKAKFYHLEVHAVYHGLHNSCSG